jgi:hypothetical protein
MKMVFIIGILKQRNDSTSPHLDLECKILLVDTSIVNEDLKTFFFLTFDTLVLMDDGMLSWIAQITFITMIRVLD